MGGFPKVRIDWTDEIDPATGNRIAWWDQPHLAYRKGLDDGVRLGYERAAADILDAFRETIGAVGGPDEFRRAMARHLAELDRVARRRAWDKAAKAKAAGP